MKKEYLLSIAIPTRNRPQFFEKTISALNAQIKKGGFNDLIQILVSDNTDNESLKINSAIIKNDNIKYFCNMGNLGYAKSINKLIKNADGKFIWFLSDDDIVLDGAVENIIKELESEKNINYLTFFTGASFNGKLFSDNLYFKDLSENYFTNGSEFLRKYWISVIFISNNIYCKDKILRHAIDNNLFENTNDVYQNSLLGISFIERYGCVKVIKKILLIDNYGNKTYSMDTSLNAPVHQYIKLWCQLKTMINRKILKLIQKDVESSLLHNGLRFVIHSFESFGFDYAGEFLKIWKNNLLAFGLRGRAFFIFCLLKMNKKSVKFIIKSISLAKLVNIDYDKIEKEVLEYSRKDGVNKMKSVY